MKLFFAVLFVILATGFISFMTLSLNEALHKHPEKFENLGDFALPCIKARQTVFGLNGDAIQR